MSILTITLLCFLVSSIWNILFWGNSTGISLPFFAAIVSTLFLWYKNKIVLNNKSTFLIHLSLVAYLSFCAFTHRNIIVLRTTIPAVFVGLGAMAFIGHNGYVFLNFLGVIEGIIKSVSKSFFAAPFAIKNAFDKLSKTGNASKTVGKVIIGLAISIPFIAIFLSLFVSADPIFNDYFGKFFEFIWQPDLVLRLLVILVVWVFLSGYMESSIKSTDLKSFLDRQKLSQKDEGLVIFVFLLMINLVFVSFIIIQLGYLFGGKNVIASSNYTYASYVHKGFFEFWAAVILVSLIIVITDYRLRGQISRIKYYVEFAWIGMILQTLVIIASGLKRIYAYEEAYGYTYLRILVALFFLWIAGVFLLFIFKIKYGRTLSWLISTGICLAFGFLVFVSTFSLDNFIAARNVDRYLNQGKEIDMRYLSILSADAYPHIKRLKSQANDPAVREYADKILTVMNIESQENLSFWGSWNLSYSASQGD